ncbi:alcohol dehydrogenase catalytic domain-containing protein [Agrobacterium pusense]|uniref:alcohol dehydrogenase catalytic domain-containing protein n=1 Tax=Agrobacterium pusense TaxID=648995 RepID=UPI001EF06AC4|nr:MULTISPECIES: alcohol dehydrogenase catalytic domain-containing protein [Agrobacterium]MDH0872563.1 alcohol dehydrogenase catalytic domain-containing protein [Agrobacterium pusense]MDH1268488.1 alcohol dehydrogenase catalytic domain-containing protein [Agrobacterium pusense]MDH2091387.1 alcohol dehydrogenase catalytic domain-containing protein [Agrobacterium pusense]WCK23453.1 alcohol dehydrogenase catalytic domain-containing protein [Agrobacterium pusense]
MKAAVYDNPGPPTVLRYADVPDPVCGPDDVLIAVEAISIEGGDLINRRSTPQQSPWIVGYAAAGTVISVGKNVRDRRSAKGWLHSICRGPMRNSGPSRPRARGFCREASEWHRPRPCRFRSARLSIV